MMTHDGPLSDSASSAPADGKAAGMRPVHVLHLINDLDDGGAQTMLCKLVEHSIDHRIKHSVVTLLDGGVNRDRVSRAGVSLEQLGFDRGKATLKAWMRMARTLRDHRPCLVQSWLYHANLAAVTSRLPTGRRTPVLWNIRHSLHDIRREKRSMRYVIRASGVLERLVDKVVYCSRTSVQQHVDVGFSQKNAAVIPNGFDCTQFKPATGAREKLCAFLGIDPERRIIGMAARHHPMKDHALLLEAAARLQADGHDLHLVLAGKGVDPANADLCRQIAAAGLGERTTLLGYRQDMAELVTGLDVYAMPSRWGEGFPNVLGEAMASGVPCAATDVGDSRWIVGDTGRVVPPGDVQAFTDDALRPLLQLGPDERSRLGAAARKRIIAEFSIDAVVAQYENLYLDIGRRTVAKAA